MLSLSSYEGGAEAVLAGLGGERAGGTLFGANHVAARFAIDHGASVAGAVAWLSLAKR